MQCKSYLVLYKLSRSLLIRISTESISFASSGPEGLKSAGTWDTASSRAGWKFLIEDESAVTAFFLTFVSSLPVAMRTRVGMAPSTKSYETSATVEHVQPSGEGSPSLGS
jgi:hypothetical protein